MKIIFLNGPPGAGKDTSAEIIIDWLTPLARACHEKLSLPCKAAFAATTNTRLPEFVNLDWEHRKEQIVPCLNVSYRQFQIDFSEKFMKPLYGPRIFANLLLSRLSGLHPDTIVIVSDCGFQLEYDTLLKASRDPSNRIERLFLIRITRPGHNFSKDSRQSVFAKGPYCFDHEAVIHNTSELSVLKTEVIATLKKFLETSNAYPSSHCQLPSSEH